MMLSMPGVLLLLGAVMSLLLFYNDMLESSDHTLSDLTELIIGAGLILVPAALVTTPIAIFYAIKRSGHDSGRIGFIIFNALMLIVGLACLAGLIVTLLVVLGNPG